MSGTSKGTQEAHSFKSPPLPVKELSKRATSALEFNRNISLKYWIRSAGLLIREASVYEAEGDHERAYILLVRFAELTLYLLPKHPEAKLPEYKERISKLNATLEAILARLETLKADLQTNYEQYQRGEIEKQSNLRRQSQKVVQQSISSQPRHVNSSDDTATRDNGESQHSTSRLEVLRRLDQLRGSSKSTPPDESATSTIHRHDFTYPSVTDSRLSISASSAAQTKHNSHVMAADFRRDNLSPGVPPKPADLASRDQVIDQAKRAQWTTSKNKPLPPIGLTEVEHEFMMSAKLENGTDLRTLFVPSSLRALFLQIAKPNTDRNLETCGILSGKLRNNAYFVTTLIIPAQDSTSDTCHTTEEESLFNYQDTHDLFTLGWIHTHPSQTCFLSSVDVHTHCSYQLMLPEAVAIVCAPSKDPSWGAFRLTDPPGIKAVMNCRQSGLFHPHAESNIYRTAMFDSGSTNTGHLREVPGMEVKVVDQRYMGKR